MVGCSSESLGKIVSVAARAETTPVPHDDDAADDPAVWVNEASPNDSLILGTDKQGGLQISDLYGNQIEYLDIGRLNNVDLRTNPYDKSNTIVVASQRAPARVVVFLVEHEQATVNFEVAHEVKMSEPYGICATVLNGKYFAVLNDKDGNFHQYEITPTFDLKLVREWATETQPEGCVVDDDAQRLYVGEEAVGIWRLSALPQDPPDLVSVARVGEHSLKADIEGLTLYQGALKTFLIASSQGNNSYAVFDTADHTYRGSFRVRGSSRFDGTSDTDGIAATTLAVRGMEEGFIVLQDGENTKPKANQNFKVISWSDVRMKLDLD
ncbi:MAG: phytase [Gammaproteobacteria bacterium]|nr:phytase [Gammaproteobacteria bacterium]